MAVPSDLVVAPLLVAALLTFVVMRITARWGLDRYVRIVLAAAGVAVAVVFGFGGDGDFTAGYWAIGSVFGIVLHDSVPKRERRATDQG